MCRLTAQKSLQLSVFHLPVDETTMSIYALLSSIISVFMWTYRVILVLQVFQGSLASLESAFKEKRQVRVSTLCLCNKHIFTNKNRSCDCTVLIITSDLLDDRVGRTGTLLVLFRRVWYPPPLTSGLDKCTHISGIFFCWLRAIRTWDLVER